MKTGPALDIRVWGARGTFPMPGVDALEFGGHTSCVEVRAGNRVMVFDAGSGIVPLGKSLMEEGITELDLFFSHASNGATFTDVDRQHLYRIKYQQADPDTLDEEVTAA